MPRQNGRHFPDDIFKWIFWNENKWISINISLKFVPRGPINNIPTLVQVMAWGRPGDKPLSEPMMVRLPSHICVTRPQWVNVIHQRRKCLNNKNKLLNTKWLNYIYISSIGVVTLCRAALRLVVLCLDTEWICWFHSDSLITTESLLSWTRTRTRTRTNLFHLKNMEQCNTTSFI